METLYPLDGLPDDETGWTMARRLATAERLDGPALGALQSAHLAQLVAHHAAHTPHFAARLAAARLAPEELNDAAGLRRLPPLTRAEFQAAGAGVFSALVPFDHLPFRVTITSGSTGRRHWPLFGYKRFSEVARVRQHQLVQHSFDVIELRISTDEALSPAQHAALSVIVQKALGHPFEVRIEEHRGPLPSSPNGKFEEFVCLIPGDPHQEEKGLP